MKSTLTLILTILATFCQADCPIECFCDQVTTTCTGDKLLTRFPKIYTTFSPTFSSSNNQPVTRLELHDYIVSYLSREDFLQIISSNLTTELSLAKNSLERLDNETFSLSLPPLQVQDLARPSTNTGRGEEHHFSSTHPSFEEEFLLKLRILDLSQNKLNYFVGGGTLRRLKILDLSSNQLQQVYNLGLILNLESVNLRDNRISYLSPDTFQGLKYLQYINLDSNILGSVDPSTFSNLPSLAHLILSSNPVTNLVPGFFWNSRVQFVDVSHVGLSSIPTSLTKTVRDFRCANNNLTIIGRTDFESYPNVGLLVLDENRIEIVEEDAFGRLDFLTRLWLNGNRLSRVPQNLPPSLHSLHLEANLITNLSSTDFKNLRNLQELNLHGNRISSVPSYVFSELVGLKNLDLRSNDIDVIYRHAFSNLSKLQSLDVSQNPIKVIVTGAFDNLGKLSLLHLSRLMEPIEFDSTLFSPLEKLQILEVEDSPHFAQKLIQDSSLSHFSSNLRELNLQRCELQDLNQVSNALVQLNLQVLKLSGNPWSCHDLYGSAIQEVFLMNSHSLVDEPVCEQPPNLKGFLVSSLNFSVVVQTTQSTPELEEGSEENLLDFTELTPDLVLEEESDPEEQIVPSYSSTSLAIRNGSVSLHSQLPTRISTSLDKVTNAPNTNSPENAPHASDADANVNPVKSTSFSGSVSFVPAVSEADAGGSISPTTNIRDRNGLSPFSNSSATGQLGQDTKNLRRVEKTGQNLVSLSESNVNATVVPMSSATKIFNKEAKVSATNRPHDSLRSGNADMIRIDRKNISLAKTSDSESAAIAATAIPDLDTVPTKSYFDSSWRGSHPLETGTNGISSSARSVSGRKSGDKKPAIPIPIGVVRTGSLDKTKTNDDNTIIDEGGKHRTKASASGSEVGGDTQDGMNDGEETGPKSIDGFPDVDGLSASSFNGNELPTSSLSSDREGNKPPAPKAFHLRRGTNNPDNPLEPQQSPSTTSSAIIVKTVVISAIVCLLSILVIISLSLAVYKVSRMRRSGTFLCGSVSRRKSEADSFSPSGCGNGINGYTRSSYTRFGKNKSSSDRSCNQNLQDFDSESDHVELSGITNRLYSENEEIYHIT